MPREETKIIFKPRQHKDAKKEIQVSSSTDFSTHDSYVCNETRDKNYLQIIGSRSKAVSQWIKINIKAFV